MVIFWECEFPENIHTDPTEAPWKFKWRGGGEGGGGTGQWESSGPNISKTKYEGKLELLEGWEKGLNHNLSGRV